MAVLRLFNPGCEIEVANGSPYFNLPKNPAILENELSVLPMYLSNNGDYILVNYLPDSEFINFWQNRFNVNFIRCDCASIYKGVAFDSFAPWGLSPRALNIAGKFDSFFSDNYRNSLVYKFLPEHKQLFNRSTSVDFFKHFILTDGNDNVYPSVNQLPIVTEDLNTAVSFFKNGMQRFGGVVFKALFSSSGRGVRIFRKNELSDNILAWTNYVIKSFGGVECEPLFNKVCDFSAHFDIVNNEPIFIGFSRFSTTESGFYRSSKVGKYSNVEFFDDNVSQNFVNHLVSCLRQSVYCKYYSGPLGIDCMVYRDGNDLKINPCVEINCRNSMGRLAMQLTDLVSLESDADFYVVTSSEYNQYGFQEPVFKQDKLYSGFLRLTPTNGEHFVAGVSATPWQ